MFLLRHMSRARTRPQMNPPRWAVLSTPALVNPTYRDKAAIKTICRTVSPSSCPRFKIYTLIIAPITAKTAPEAPADTCRVSTWTSL